MSRFFQATFTIFIFAVNLAAQSPAPTSPAPAPPGKAPQTQSKSPALPAASPSATPTTEDLINSLGPADLQAVITLLKSNFTNPDAITDIELNRATVEGLLVRLPRGVMLLPGKENVPSAAPSAFYSEVIAGQYRIRAPRVAEQRESSGVGQKSQHFRRQKGERAHRRSSRHSGNG